MYKVKNILTIALISCLYVSCLNNNQTDDSTIVPNYLDPDPLTVEELATAPKAPSSLFVAVNIDGQIRSFPADAPADYSLIVDDVCTDEFFVKFKLSDDGKYLLYLNSNKDLILYDITSSTVKAVLQEGVSCDEIQFIDNDRIQYSHNGDIHCYTITTERNYIMVDNSELQCNHGAIVSPDGSKIVFKNQDPNQTEYAVFAWAEVTGDTVDTCTYLDQTEDINLLELLDFLWIDNETIFFKPSSGINTRIMAYTIEGSIPLNANVTVDGSVIQFTRLTISDDLTKLCIYGSNGLYQVDLSSFDFESTIAVDEIYLSEAITTRFADYSKNSDYLVAATSGCINIYVADTIKQTDFDSTGIINEGETLYYLCCN